MKTLHDQIARRCKHFSGVLNSTCKKGVDYATVRDESARPCVCPCMTGLGEPCATKCVGAEFPTEAEVQARIAEIEDCGRKIGLARHAIVEFTKGARGMGGTIDCPACGSPRSLRFSVARCNGHIHASCTTAGCVSWME